MRVFSFGGGVQSTAALVLAAQGELAVDAFLFANVGDDSENPDTLRYVREVAAPYAAAHGLTLVELQRRRRTGEVETILGRMTERTHSIVIPARVYGRPLNRQCTQDFKIKIVASWCYRHGARKAKPATTLLGISLDEFQRMRNDSGISYTRLSYPLVDRRMTRQDCINTIAGAGLPVPPKSSCWFCPFHSIAAWRELRDTRPDLFQQACDLEAAFQGRGKMRKPIRLTRSPLMLAQAVQGEQPSLFEDDACESGYCMV